MPLLPDLSKGTTRVAKDRSAQADEELRQLAHSHCYE
jgi:hypothetical protein